MTEPDLNSGNRLDRLHAVLDSLVDSVITMDEHGIILDVNAAVETQLGYRRQELIGQDVTILMPAPHAARHQGYVKRYLDTGERRIIGIGRHVQAVRKDGSLLDISLAVSEAQVDGKRVFAGVLRDITLQVQRQRELQRQKDELAIQARINQLTQTAESPQQLLTEVMQALVSLVELGVQSRIGLFLVDTEETRGSDSFERSHLPGRMGLRLVTTMGAFSDEFLEREAWIPLGACLCGRAAVSGEVVVSGNCLDGPLHEHRFTEMLPHGHYIMPLKSGGEVIGVIFMYTNPDPSRDGKRLSLFETLGNQIGIAVDRLWTMSALRASREQLYQLATQDPLTGLKNRRALLQCLEQERNRTQRQNNPIGLILVDIDRFKTINDNHGHPVGDEVLVAISRRLAEAVRPCDTVGRLGGEEFMIILPNTDLAGAAIIAERIRAHVAAETLRCGDNLDLTITISLGAASTGLHAADGPDNETLLQEADSALYRAKAGGRNRVELAQTGAGKSMPGPHTAVCPGAGK